MRAHTIGTTARTFVSGGIIALSLAVLLLAATASTADAARLSPWCAPLPPTPTTPGQFPDGCIDATGEGARSFDFGDRQVGTTSPAHGFVLWVKVPDTFNPSISVSGDYAQTNTNCPPTLSAPSLCLISITFTPTGIGPKKGTLRTGPGGPTATLTGNGVTTPTPPVLPLRLNVSQVPQQTLGRRGLVRGIHAQSDYGCLLPACPKYDSTLVLRGDVKETTKQLETNVPTTIRPRLKHLKRLKEEPTSPRVKIKFTATDEFGQTATEKTKVTLCSRLVNVPGQGRLQECRWHPSQK